MSKCFSLTATRNNCLKSTFRSSGLRSKLTDLGDGTVIHCWVPKTYKPTKRNLVLIHGIGANAMWQWTETIKFMSPHFNLYVPDLLFFGDSFTTRSDRSDSFQAQCVMRVMEEQLNSVEKRIVMSVVGLSYGGFVAYCMAAQFKERVEKVVICCAGVCLEEKDLKDGLFPVEDLVAAADILVPQTTVKMRELLRFAFVKPPKTPSCLFNDYMKVMGRQYVKEQKELIRAIPKERKISNLTKLTQPTLMLWGEQDQIFPLELGHRLKRHLGENGQLIVIKKAGHAFIYEKPKEFKKHLKSFLITATSAPTDQQNPK